VLDEAPDVPPALVSTLLGFARHADQDGQRSYPSVETLMRYTRKRERQVRDDIKELRKRGLLIVSVDQSAAAHIRADRRPTVYELPMHQRRDDATGCSTPQVVDDAPDAARGAPDRTPSDSRGAPQRSTGCDPASNGVRHSAPEEDMNKPRKKESDAGASSSSSRSRQEDDDEARAQTKIKERKDRQHRVAVRDIVRRLDTDSECAKATIAYIRDMVLESTGEVIGAVDRYVKNIPDDELAEHHESATWEIRFRRETERRHAQLADGVLRQIADKYPDAPEGAMVELRAVYIAALRTGHGNGEVVAALNASHHNPQRGDPIIDYIDAINALGRQAA
jgi:hypothetical protein